MKKELLEFIRENNLSPFNGKTRMRSDLSLFKTSDGKQIHNRVLEKISKNFIFEETANLINFFSFSDNLEEIKRRQEFFASLTYGDNSLFKQLEAPKKCWKPKYEVVVVTENEALFVDLQKFGCSVRFLTSEQDLEELKNCEIVQVLDCENFSLALESLPQSVFLEDIDEVYLERYVEIISSWKTNLEILNNSSIEEIKKIVNELSPLLKLVNEKSLEKITIEQANNRLDEINEKVFGKLRNMSLSGEKLIEVLNKKLPKEIEEIVINEIKNSRIPEHLFITSMPVALDEQELEKFMKNQQAEEHTSQAEAIKRNSKLLKDVPEKIKMLENLLIYHDFVAGIFRFIKTAEDFPKFSEELLIDKSRNIFLENPQPISFKLDENIKCSVLTGANSGGKTTLLEHLIQIISLANLGLKVSGKVSMPVFSEVYYFAKNKGSMSRGAFENLLEQMAEIKTGKRTLILADEMEAVTEPGVAGKIVNATAEYFIKKNCFIIIATHLGQEIIKHLPQKARVDGIEARGLDENFELIVEHNPILGKLASSTPELIVEKLANSKKEDYFRFINDYLKNNKI